LLGKHAQDALQAEEILAQPDALDHGVAGGRTQEAGQHLDRRALARAVRPEEAEEPPARDTEGEMVDGGGLAEDLGQALDHDGVRARVHAVQLYTAHFAFSNALPYPALRPPAPQHEGDTD